MAPDELTAILNGALGTKPPQLDIAAKPQHGELVLVPATLAEVTDTAWALGRIVEVRETDGADPGGVGLRYLRMVAGPESTIRADLGMLSAKLGVRVLDVTA